MIKVIAIFLVSILSTLSYSSENSKENQKEATSKYFSEMDELSGPTPKKSFDMQTMLKTKCSFTKNNTKLMSFVRSLEELEDEPSGNVKITISDSYRSDLGKNIVIDKNEIFVVENMNNKHSTEYFGIRLNLIDKTLDVRHINPFHLNGKWKCTSVGVGIKIKES